MKRFGVCLLLIGFVFIVCAQKTITPVRLIDKLTTKPEFPGGDSMLQKYLERNIQYPQMERDNDIQGKVVVRFMVDENGAIQDVKAIRTVSPGLDKEALRVTRLMPDWRPATYHNKPIAVYYILPVKFHLL